MYLLGKILGIGLACSVPITVVSSHFYWKGESKPAVLKLEKDKDFEENCYVLGEVKDNQSQKLLVCVNPADFSEIYYLFKKEQNQNSYTKATSVIKQQNTDSFLVKLEGENNGEVKIETNNQGEWNSFKEEINVTSRKCQLSYAMGTATTLLCSSWKSSWVRQHITLKEFKVNR